MERSDSTKVAILGAGRGGLSLLDLLHRIPSIEIVGITDRNPAAPGLERARELHVPIATNVQDLIKSHGVTLIGGVRLRAWIHAESVSTVAGRPTH